MRKVFIAVSMAVAIVALVGAYSAYRGARVKSAQPCINSLRQIEGAKDQWALETQALPGAPVTLSNILPYLSTAPTCHVADASYNIGKVGEEPRCPTHGTTSHFKPDHY
jgi:hypothetical protein